MNDITTQQYMSILYPTLAALSLGYTVLSFIFWWTTRRSSVAFFNALFFATETAVLTLLTFTTGSHPMLDIERFRFLVVWSRTALLVVLLICFHVTYVMIKAQGTSKQGTETHD